MRGCNNFCSFCIVPYTRGRERSRTNPNITAEVGRLVQEEGVKQVTLLGQNVNSYTSEGKDFADLLEKLSAIPGLERIRFTSPHPKDFPDHLLDVISSKANVCKQIHIPAQSGNTEMLKRMRRNHTRESYLELIENIRKRIPGVALSSDFICGFCDETE
jgi:tRNA-2-methylthio-N6-dimethylallyladenosine synthase